MQFYLTVTTKSTVSYTNIPPGKYTFQIEGSSDGKKWSSIPATFEFSVRPNFYETYLFYVILTGTIIAILFLIYRWRLSFINRQNIKLKKVNAELDRFVYSASHELRSPLTSVLGIVSLAKDVKGDISEYLGHIENSVKRLDSFIKDIIDYSRNTRLEIANAKIDTCLQKLGIPFLGDTNFKLFIFILRRNMIKHQIHFDPF